MSSKIRVQRICQHCGSEFTARTSVTKYCGDTCAKRAYKARKRDEKVEASNRETHVVKFMAVEDLITKDILNVKEASTLLGCSTRTTYRLIETGALKAANLGERMTRIRRADIDKLLS